MGAEDRDKVQRYLSVEGMKGVGVAGGVGSRAEERKQFVCSNALAFDALPRTTDMSNMDSLWRTRDSLCACALTVASP